MVKALLKNWINPLIRSYPDFLMIGTQKAGTTSFYNYLIQHPQIVKNNSWKEIRFFDVPDHYSQGMGWYLRYFPYKFQKGDRLTFDASPGYLYFPEVPKLIKQDLGDIKMIINLREPVSRAYSAWKMYYSFGVDEGIAPINRSKADRRSFAEAVRQELAGEPNPMGYPYDYLARGRYYEQIQRYYHYFPQENFLIFELQEINKNLEDCLQKTCDFLAIDPFPPDLLASIKEQKYNVGRDKQPDPELDDLFAELKAYFRPHNEQLFNLVGKRYEWD